MNIEKKIIIVGAGGFGREVAWTIEDCNKISKTYSIEGFLDEDESLVGKKIKEIPILGNLGWFKKNNSSNIFCVVAVSDPKNRQKIVNLLETMNVKFATIIHPSVIYSKSVCIESGCVIQAGVILTVDIKIGSHVHINIHSTVGHDSIIEDFVTVNPGVHINGKSIVGSGTNIGSGAVMKQGIKIGKNVVIGAGSVLINNVPDDSLCVGVPGEIKKSD